MGFRYRKSINLGGGFRINLSKSGVGYSWGVKGFRVTKTARGTTRRTYSLPGTGISYVQETGKRKGSPASFPSQKPAAGNRYDTQSLLNAQATQLVSEGLEAMLKAAGRALVLRRAALIGLIASVVLGMAYPLFFLPAAVFAILLIVVRTKGVIRLEYSIDEDEKAAVEARMGILLRIADCAKVWRVIETSRVIDRKYAAGAGETVKRMPCAAKTAPPFPFKANVPVAAFKSGKETLVFLPDKLIIVQGVRVGALAYEDFSVKTGTTRFVESEAVPRDAAVVGHTWKYVNKSGGPDRRFKDNRQLPICLYGQLEITSPKGLHTVLMFSDVSVL